MYSTGSQSMFSTASKLFTVLAIALLVLGETASATITWGQSYYAEISVDSLTLDLHKLTVNDGGSVYIVILSDGYRNYINLTIYSIGNALYLDIITNNDTDHLAVQKLEAIVISGRAVHVSSTRAYMHSVDLHAAELNIKFKGSGSGEIKIIASSEDAVENKIIVPTAAEPPNPLKSVALFFSWLGRVWIGIIEFFNIVVAVFDAVWTLLLFIVHYLNIALYVTYTYILPNLALFIGIYFFMTLSMAVASIPKRGFQALIDWGKLWYSHIMALINFVKMLAEWAYKLVNIIIKLVDAITPFT